MSLTLLDSMGPHSNLWYSARTRVVNLHHGFPEGAVYIGRPGKGHDGYFGNPILLSSLLDREEVLRAYESYLKQRIETDPIFRLRVAALSGKTLVCFCVPYPCHGMVLARYADALANT